MIYKKYGLCRYFRTKIPNNEALDGAECYQTSVPVLCSTFSPETLAAAAPAEAAGVGSGLSGGLGGGLDVRRLPFSHLHSAHTPGLRDGKHTDNPILLNAHRINNNSHATESVHV